MHLTEAMFDELLQIQAQILRRSALAARTGGRVVYATCSILPEEGEQQIQRFLADHPSFRLVAEARSMPDVADEDGFYHATLERTDDA
jgi:16S rRNA (cytosine967-C5)-methyltransferase